MQENSHKMMLRKLAEATDKPHKGTAGLIASLYERVPLQREINNLFNQLEDENSEAVRRSLKDQIQRKLAVFRESAGGGHSNPDWIIATMDAIAELVDSNYHEAIKLHEMALGKAKNNWQQAVSLSNLSDVLRYEGQFNLAIKHGLKAIEIDPCNEGFWVNLTLALYGAGEMEAAEEIILAVPEVSDLGSPRSVWRAYLLSHVEFQEMRNKIPALDKLFSTIE